MKTTAKLTFYKSKQNTIFTEKISKKTRQYNLVLKKIVKMALLHITCGRIIWYNSSQGN